MDDVLECPCGSAIVACAFCGDIRCLSCDPYEEGEDKCGDG